MALPEGILVSVYKDFLTSRKFVRFDWAMSWKVGRARLLEVLRSRSMCLESCKEAEYGRVAKTMFYLAGQKRDWAATIKMPWLC